MSETIWLKSDFGQSSLSREILSSRSNTRARTFQERLLSRRILDFGQNQLFWECHELFGSEDKRDDLEAGLVEHHTLFSQVSRNESFMLAVWDAIETGDPDLSDVAWRESFRRHMITTGMSQVMKCMAAFERFYMKQVKIDICRFGVNTNSLLHDYSKRHLSVPNDKLVAFDGKHVIRH